MLILSLLAANIFSFTSKKDDSLKPQARMILRAIKDDWDPVSEMAETLTGVILGQGMLR